jgi:hypothetical protein
MVFTISEIYFYPITKLFTEKNLILFFNVETTTFSIHTSTELLTSKIDETQSTTTQSLTTEPTTTQSLTTTKQSPVVNISQERYQLVMKYEQDKLTDANAPFKRILFWNDVKFL